VPVARAVVSPARARPIVDDPRISTAQRYLVTSM